MPVGLLNGALHGMALWVGHVDPPIGMPWNAIGTSHWDIPWHGSMGRSWGSTNGHAMECHWDFSCGLHGMALWVGHGDPPMLLYE